MLSSNALKYKISVSPSYYAGIVISLLYLLLLLLSLMVVSLTIMTLFFYAVLVVFALYAGRKAYLQTDQLLLSESGLVERNIGELCYSGKISPRSFYNGFFILLRLEMKEGVFTVKNTTQFITVYKDAVSEEHYRLLARLINSGRDES